jgi:hypothetical protein
MWSKLLCFIGFHDWTRIPVKQLRWQMCKCKRCQAFSWRRV